MQGDSDRWIKILIIVGLNLSNKWHQMQNDYRCVFEIILVLAKLLMVIKNMRKLLTRSSYISQQC